MDPLKFTTIAHRDHRLMNPLDPQALVQALERVAPAPGDRAIDVGCGKGVLLVTLAKRYGTAGLGVDINPAFIAEALALAFRLDVVALVKLVEGDASALDPAPASFDLGICIGAAHALGGYPGTLRGLSRLVRPGGHLLVGQGYWKHPPAPEYLERLGACEDEMTTHEGNIAAGIAHGLAERGAWVSGDQDWDRYEDLYANSVEDYVAEHPGDPDSQAMRERIGRWRDTTLRWGRETLGFGLYLFERA